MVSRAGTTLQQVGAVRVHGDHPLGSGVEGMHYHVGIFFLAENKRISGRLH